MKTKTRKYNDTMVTNHFGMHKQQYVVESTFISKKEEEYDLPTVGYQPFWTNLNNLLIVVGFEFSFSHFLILLKQFSIKSPYRLAITLFKISSDLIVCQMHHAIERERRVEHIIILWISIFIMHGGSTFWKLNENVIIYLQTDGDIAPHAQWMRINYTSVIKILLNLKQLNLFQVRYF